MKVQKTQMIRIRATPKQKKVLEKAAEDAGLCLSTWLRIVGLQQAAKPRMIKT
jgi:uncharacterized protein (DUF1778 family)